MTFIDLNLIGNEVPFFRQSVYYYYYYYYYFLFTLAYQREPFHACLLPIFILLPNLALSAFIRYTTRR
jgi:hypothetical protein